MKIQLTGFRGELPLLDPRLLPEANAQVARNVYLRHGTLKPEHGPAPVDELPGVARPANLYRYEQGNDGEGFWFSWRRGLDVDVVRSPIAADEYARVYWTGDGPPKMGSLDMVTRGDGPYPSNWFELGVPSPKNAPSAATPDNRPLPNEVEGEYPPPTAVDTVYTVTAVTRYGEEGAPSPPSPIVTRWDETPDNPPGGGVIVNLPATPDGSRDVITLRLYRSESGGTYQYVADLPAGTGQYHDRVRSEQMGGTLESIEWDMPAPQMRGLTALPGGMLAGFFDNTLAFCEAYRPHAWPVAYQLALSDPIVGIVSISAGLLVTTTGQPWLVVGSSPAAMSPMQLDALQSCVAKRSMVDMGGYALYASPDGLVAVGGRESQVATRTVLSRDQWQAMDPAGIEAWPLDGRYIARYKDGMFAFTPGEGIEFFDTSAEGGYYDTRRDTLYLIRSGSVHAWRGGEPMTLRWRSKIHEFPPGAAGFNCARLVARGYPVRLRLLADGATVFDGDVPSTAMMRLPAGYAEAREWEIEIESSHEVNNVQVATSPGELV